MRIYKLSLKQVEKFSKQFKYLNSLYALIREIVLLTKDILGLESNCENGKRTINVLYIQAGESRGASYHSQ